MCSPVMTVVYALSIADRFSISTLIEPIRLELHLSDSGIAFLTGVALALFYVTIGIPIALLADRANRRDILAIALALWSAMTALCGWHKPLAVVLARFGVGNWRGRRHATGHIHYWRINSRRKSGRWR